MECETGIVGFEAENRQLGMIYQSTVTAESIISHKEKRTFKGTIIQFLYWLLEKMGEDLSY